MHVFPVETDRLSMRPIVSDDAALFEQLYTDAETMRFIGAPLSPERAAKSFRSALASMQRQPIEQLFLTVTEKATRTDVGICSLQNFDVEQRSVQAGVMFIATARAKGYSKESFIGLIQQVFGHLPVDELWVQFAVEHVAVQRAVLSVGFARRRAAAGGRSPEDDRSSGAQRNGPEHAIHNESRVESGASVSAWAVHRATWSPPPTLRNAR